MEDLCDFVAGWGAGAIGLAVGHPMDTIKTIQQMDNRSLSSSKVVTHIMKTQGIIGFYRGMMFPLLSAGTLNSVFFGVYGNSLKALQMSRGNDPKHIVPQDITVYEDTFVAGCIGGVVQTMMACPSEFVKVRMQTGREYFGIEEQTFASSRKPGGGRSVYRVIADAYRTFGIRVLYTGFVPMLWRSFIELSTDISDPGGKECPLTSLAAWNLESLIFLMLSTRNRDVSASGLYVLAYLYMRHHMHGHLELHPGAFETLVAGGMAGTLSWIPVVPLDTIKSRIQADDLRNPSYKGTMDCAIKLFRLGGIHVLFKGFIMIALRAFPVNASVFLCYDTIMQCLKYSLGN